MNVAERLVQLLDEHGIDVVFGIGGTHSLPLLGAFERLGRPRFVAARNEQGAAYMATGYARASGRPGVVITSTGPGALNALSGIADAAWSSLPLLHITTYADDPPFTGGIHDSPHQHEVMGLVGTHVVRLRTEDVDAAFSSAWARCTTQPSGPVTLEVYSRLWNSGVGSACVPKRTEAVDREPSPDLSRARDTLEAAASPVLFVGGGVIRENGADAVLQLAEHIGAPILTSSQGKGIATWDHPLYLGPWGADPAVQDYVTTCDVALVVGTKISALATGHWSFPFPAHTFWIDLSAGEHPKYPQIVPVRSDGAAACTALQRSLTHRPRPVEAEVADVRTRVRAAAAGRAPVEWDVLEALGSGLPENAAVAFDMNKASFWMMKYLPVGRAGVHAFSSYLCMGSALPVAIGMAEAGRSTVVAVTGDGGLQMALAELSTLAEQRQQVAVVVLVDGAYGLLRDNGAMPGVGGATDLGVTLWNPDFSRLASTFDMAHASATSGSELVDAINGVDQPKLIEVPLDFSRQW